MTSDQPIQKAVIQHTRSTCGSGTAPVRSRYFWGVDLGLRSQGIKGIRFLRFRSMVLGSGDKGNACRDAAAVRLVLREKARKVELLVWNARMKKSPRDVGEGNGRQRVAQ